MKETDDLDFKAEIDEISKNIDGIIQNIDRMDPTKKDPEADQE